MRRFVLPGITGVVGDCIDLPADLRRHLFTVLRLLPGEEVQLLDGAGLLLRVHLQSDQKANVLASARVGEPPLALNLIQGVAKGEKLELVLQKGTELGVGSFQLTQMERSVGRIKSDRQEKRLQRWQKIVQEAARQCGQPWLPRLEVASDFRAVVTSSAADLKLMLWEEGSSPLPDLLPQQAPASASVIVGPEGGISPREAEIARAAGYLPVRLGPRILRTETAGLAIMSILQYLYGDLTTTHADSIGNL